MNRKSTAKMKRVFDNPPPTWCKLHDARYLDGHSDPKTDLAITTTEKLTSYKGLRNPELRPLVNKHYLITITITTNLHLFVPYLNSNY
jgi:hypothetical protein